MTSFTALSGGKLPRLSRSGRTHDPMQTAGKGVGPTQGLPGNNMRGNIYKYFWGPANLFAKGARFKSQIGY